MKAPSILITLLTIVGCGAIPGGGIVDNGNKPKDPVTPSSDQRVPTQIEILAEYVIEAPSPYWKVTTDVGSTTLAQGELSIRFMRSPLGCEAQPERLDSGLRVYWCSASETIFEVDINVFVLASHEKLTPETEGILRSFRKK